MATYSWLCRCGVQDETHQGIAAYCDLATKLVPVHCGVPMERMLTVNGENSALNNALAGDRHYDGLVATDGTLINSRSKHRQYMKDNNLTIANDFKSEWAQAAKEREPHFTGGRNDKKRREILEREFTRREQSGG